MAKRHGAVATPKPGALPPRFQLDHVRRARDAGLIDELWGERPPATATKALQTYVSQLRRALGPDLIVTRTPGHLLRVDEGTIDAARFRHLASEGRALAATG